MSFCRTAASRLLNIFDIYFSFNSTSLEIHIDGFSNSRPTDLVHSKQIRSQEIHCKKNTGDHLIKTTQTHEKVFHHSHQNSLSKTFKNKQLSALYKDLPKFKARFIPHLPWPKHTQTVKNRNVAQQFWLRMVNNQMKWTIFTLIPASKAQNHGWPWCTRGVRVGKLSSLKLNGFSIPCPYLSSQACVYCRAFILRSRFPLYPQE